MRMNAYDMSAGRVHAVSRDTSQYSSERLPDFQQMVFYYIIIDSKDEFQTNILFLAQLSIRCWE